MLKLQFARRIFIAHKYILHAGKLQFSIQCMAIKLTATAFQDIVSISKPIIVTEQSCKISNSKVARWAFLFCRMQQPLILAVTTCSL